MIAIIFPPTEAIGLILLVAMQVTYIVYDAFRQDEDKRVRLITMWIILVITIACYVIIFIGINR